MGRLLLYGLAGSGSTGRVRFAAQLSKGEFGPPLVSANKGHGVYRQKRYARLRCLRIEVFVGRDDELTIRPAFELLWQVVFQGPGASQPLLARMIHEQAQQMRSSSPNFAGSSLTADSVEPDQRLLMLAQSVNGYEAHGARTFAFENAGSSSQLQSWVAVSGSWINRARLDSLERIHDMLRFSL